MLFDDRLATVLRTSARSDAGLRTQFRQLVDLLGSQPDFNGGIVESAAYLVLGAIQDELAAEDQSRILREPGLRIRNPMLVAMLAEGQPKPAAAAMATARLSEEEWRDLIPRLPVTARGFLRHRRDLPQSVKDLLARLGVGDLVLPDPGLPPAETIAPEPPAATTRPRAGEGIGELLRRIESFRQGREATPASSPQTPARPVANFDEPDPAKPRPALEFRTDAEGTVVWASEGAAPLLVGMRLTARHPGSLLTVEPRIAALFARHQPVFDEGMAIDAAAPISGEWRLDAVPTFDPQTGGFTGYTGCLRRPVAPPPVESHADQMRQVLHELRTPVNAIQGFAEIIQQQLFGPAPHEYRAHAAAIAVDAAKLLAGFDEVDRLVKLDSDAMTLEPGRTDLREALAETVARVDGVLRSRNAGFALAVDGSPFTVALDRTDALALCWRLLATAAGALAPGQEVGLDLASDGETITLAMEAPPALLAPRPADPARSRAVSAGMFGPAFALKLAQAEARAAGGALETGDNSILLTLPVLTEPGEAHSAEGRSTGA